MAANWISPQEIARFDWQAYLWVKADEGADWKWDYENLEGAIMCAASHAKLGCVTQLRNKHFVEIKLNGAFSRAEFNGDHQAMIMNVLQKNREIPIERDMFHTKKRKGRVIKKTKTKKCAKLEELYKNIPIIQPTSEWLEKRSTYEKLKAQLPSIIDKALTNPLQNSNGTCGVYLGLQLKEKPIVNYVGSTTDWKQRENNHVYLSTLDENDDSNLDGDNCDEDHCDEQVKFKKNAKDFHKHIVTNKFVWGKDIILIFICECPEGLQMFLEADVFDYLTSLSSSKTVEVDLKNSCRPLKDIYTVDSFATIYQISREGDPNRYAGSTMYDKFFERQNKHDKRAFHEKSKCKLYTWMRSITEDKWDDSINMLPIEVVPSYMRFEREKLFIDKNDLVRNGLNTMNIGSEEKPEQREERLAKQRLQRANETDEERKTRLAKEREWREKRIANETTEQKNARLQKIHEDYTKRSANETTEQKAARIQKGREWRAKKIANETTEQKAAILQKGRERQAKIRSNETVEQKEARLQKGRERHAKKMESESVEERKIRLAKLSEKDKKKRAEESEEDRKKRLANQREKDKEKREKKD